jgi:hypothetical protein
MAVPSAAAAAAAAPVMHRRVQDCRTDDYYNFYFGTFLQNFLHVNRPHPRFSPVQQKKFPNVCIRQSGNPSQ